MAESLAEYRRSSLGELIAAKTTLESTLDALPDAVFVIAPDGSFAALGLPIPNLITSPTYALQVVVIVSLWSHFGYNLLLFGAALESIPSELGSSPASTGRGAISPAFPE